MATPTLPKTLKEKIFETFDYLHQNPELSWGEIETTKYVTQILKDAGCHQVVTFDDCTGVIGDIGDFSGNRPIIAIRADMDALHQEVNGKMQANHSCGHDAHMTMVLGVLWSIQHNEQLKKQIGIRFIFQPAEEVGAGALKLVEKGIVDDVDYLYGIHLRPIQEMAAGYASPAIVHGATRSIEFKINGDDAHGARPHLTQNAVEIGAYIMNALHSLYFDPNIPHSAKVTRFLAGGKNTNIIPGKASLAIDMRAQTNELMDAMHTTVLDIIKNAKEIYQTNIEITNDYGIVAAESSEGAQEFAAKAIENVLGSKKLTPPVITPGGDDFHFYKVNKPHLKATMIGLGCDLAPGLHHPYMHFEIDSLLNGIGIFNEILNLHGLQD
ncbi:M20 peptidase aminoacylase family protein [Neobacillus soli]|uniref:M20 peptidase aminoacylase family protein n=1 Tax=Neobacillus soli TaxID=220688 RepID=UPI000B134639|nr:M20 peptidase aminoacylase family protein [Neobacillus soli]